MKYVINTTTYNSNCRIHAAYFSMYTYCYSNIIEVVEFYYYYQKNIILKLDQRVESIL
jgi:hypothetical protein